MNKNVLILDGALNRETYQPTPEWRDHLGDVPSTSVHLPTGELPPPIDGFSHVIVTGSEASIVRHKDWYDPAIEIIRAARDKSVPVLGSCFGHQMLALALSGPDHVGHTKTPEMGWIEVEITADDPLLDGLPRPWRVFASHFDEVVAPPAPWRVLARNDKCAVHAMRYGDLPVWGIQPHPEIPPDHARVLMNAFLAKAGDLEDFIRGALAQEPADDFMVGDIVRRFLAAG